MELMLVLQSEVVLERLGCYKVRPTPTFASFSSPLACCDPPKEIPPEAEQAELPDLGLSTSKSMS